MKPKFLYILILAILSAGVFYAGWYVHRPISGVGVVDGFETARLTTIAGWELKVLTNTSSTNRNFIFLDNDTGDIVTTLSVGNINIEPPSYRIVKGHTHDWLVVTRIAESGTGYMDRFDAWYILGSSEIMKEVLTYPAQGLEVPDKNGNNTYWTSVAATNGYSDDLAVDVVTTTKSCSTTAYGGDKACTESSHTVHYAWNGDKEMFVASSI